jgi:pyrroloquinoline-quinone synthase
LAYDEIGAKVIPIDEIMLVRYHMPEDQQRITRAVRLSHEFELLLYETVMAVIPSEE